MYTITQKAFNTKIKSISKTRQKFSDDVQAALIAATYLCIAHDGGTTPLQQVLDVVGTTAHRQGVTSWIETYAPAMLREDKIVKNKTAYAELDVQQIVADFDAYVEETGMGKVRWDAIAVKHNTTKSVFDLDKSFDNFLKKLENNALPELAAALRKAEQDYFNRAIRAELVVNK